MSAPSRRAFAAGLALSLAASLSVPAAHATPPAPAVSQQAKKPAAASIVLLPSMLADGDVLRRPRAGDGELVDVVASVDGLLADTAQDLGLVMDRRAGAPVDPARLGEHDLIERARAAAGVVVLPSLQFAGADVELRLALADPTTRALVVRRERMARADLAVRAVVMLRDLLTGRGAPKGIGAAGSGLPEPPPKSLAGRITLIANATLFGGLVGFSIQRASGSDDPRLLYPLIAVGAGIGLGGSIVASGEWEVSAADAWYIAAGAWWPTAAGHLIYQGRFSQYGIESDRWVFGLLGGTAGLTLSTLGLSLGHMSEGGAVLAHSGGGLGLLFGGLVELTAKGNIYQTPFSGMGYGAALGWLAAAAVATQVRPSATRVLALDLGAVLGGLAGAAAGSPLLLGDPDSTKQRGWVAATGGGALVGAGVALLLTRGSKDKPDTDKKVKTATGAPMIGALGESVIGDRRAPIVGLGWSGQLQ